MVSGASRECDRKGAPMDLSPELPSLEIEVTRAGFKNTADSDNTQGADSSAR
jgi:hypothetical protein